MLQNPQNCEGTSLEMSEIGSRKKASPDLGKIGEEELRSV